MSLHRYGQQSIQDRTDRGARGACTFAASSFKLLHFTVRTTDFCLISCPSKHATSTPHTTAQKFQAPHSLQRTAKTILIFYPHRIGEISCILLLPILRVSESMRSARYFHATTGPSHSIRAAKIRSTDQSSCTHFDAALLSCSPHFERTVLF
ncbi:hypothetical protein N431DRAFT_177907 [Stipitochalara longipes BDJ]|nr:hypothetical protein N431DRAFT_177907 [Stipitochalara longipes BDJ]